MQTWKTFCCITIALSFFALYKAIHVGKICKIPCARNVESSSWQFHLIDSDRSPFVHCIVHSHGWQQPKYQKSCCLSKDTEGKSTVVLANPLLFVEFEINCDNNLADRISTRTRNWCKPSAHVTRSNQILKLSQETPKLKIPSSKWKSFSSWNFPYYKLP